VRCFFCGCNVTISHDRTWGRRYLPILAREVAKPGDPLAQALRHRTLTRNFQGYSTHGD
jgi:hypothetical protein